jgi:site-specific DNA-methyltransferase (adenine-specific)
MPFKRHSVNVMLKSSNNDRCTPDNLLVLVREVFNGPIDLDPCDNPHSHTKAKKSFYGGPTDSGLVRLWSGKVYCNPPYGRKLPQWVDRVIDQFTHAEEIILLTPSRTDTRWFTRLRQNAALCFWSGRLTFLGCKDPAPFPSLISYFGPNRWRFIQTFSNHGWVVA